MEVRDHISQIQSLWLKGKYNTAVYMCGQLSAYLSKEEGPIKSHAIMKSVMDGLYEL